MLKPRQSSQSIFRLAYRNPVSVRAIGWRDSYGVRYVQGPIPDTCNADGRPLLICSRLRSMRQCTCFSHLWALVVPIILVPLAYLLGISLLYFPVWLPRLLLTLRRPR